MTNASKPVYTLPPDAVWLITGCSSGLGLSLAKLIAAHPTQRIVATARNSERLKTLLPSESPRLLLVELDVTSGNSITEALVKVLKHPGFGRIDVLVNNAGYGLVGDTEVSLPKSSIALHSSDAEHAKARALIETNFWGVAQLTLHAMRIMRETNAESGQQGGVVVQISSMGGFMGFAGNAWYHAAKFAVEGFTESVSREVRPEWNIHFTIAEPGGIDTQYATSSLARLAPHPAYAAPDTPARVLIAATDNPEFRKGWSKADNMSKAIYEVVGRTKTIPIRFPLGTASFGILREEVNTMAKEFDEIKYISLGVDTDEETAPLTEYYRFA
ncbi:hypothetical protein N0V93_010183 [Gnomoniopsis smithogilvyi]|uniref:Uncharacterized protein n=1 Tax=Gnomoniopsis smithogilvyi TaxID=1191159 RepID=A0A9W9CT57_9PEZI|nr:hypothetical protein N0V93_010183 [Gnomoniopsis smithogilvyi]